MEQDKRVEDKKARFYIINNTSGFMVYGDGYGNGCFDS